MSVIFRETKHFYWQWEPVFEQYETITVTDYCDDCGQEHGSHEEQRGVNLLRYDLKKYKKTPMYIVGRMMEEIMIDNIMRPSILELMTKGFNGGGTIKVPRAGEVTDRDRQAVIDGKYK